MTLSRSIESENVDDRVRGFADRARWRCGVARRCLSWRRLCTQALLLLAVVSCSPRSVNNSRATKVLGFENRWTEPIEVTHDVAGLSEHE